MLVYIKIKGDATMWKEIIIALITLAGTLGGALIVNKKSTALFTYRLERLEEYTDKHDELVERTVELEKHSAILDEQMSSAKSKIDRLDEIVR